MVIPIHKEIASVAAKLGLLAKCMPHNASLAVALATDDGPLGVDPGATGRGMPQNFAKSLAEAAWPGRCQVIRNGWIEWCIDDAHTVKSLAVCNEWYAGIAHRHPTGSFSPTLSHSPMFALTRYK